MKFTAEGLVLGAGTVLAPSDAAGRDIQIEGHEARLLTLLAAAHLRPPRLEVLNHIRKAAERWSEGQVGLALVHLALSRAERLEQPRPAAQRLFLADGLLQAGVEPEAVLGALNIDVSELATLAKDYNPNQPRVPAGNGRTSGWWTHDPASGGTAGRRTDTQARDAKAPLEPLPGGKIRPAEPPPGPGEWLRTLSDPKLKAVSLLALRAGIGGVLFNLILFPNKSLQKDGLIAGRPPIRYSWKTDERSLSLTYTSSNGAHHIVSALVGLDGLLRTQQGQVIGRILPNSYVAIDRNAVLPKGTGNDDNLNFCPSPKPDKIHEKGLEFEDHMKRLINPENPTPRGFAILMPNPFDNGVLVHIDDCQHRTGILFEYKGTTYAEMIHKGNESLADGVLGKLHGQAIRQIEASEGRPIVWIFAEKAAADEVSKRFLEDPKIGQRINIHYQAWWSGL